MTEQLRTAAKTALQRAADEKRLAAREHGVIANYINWLEDQNAGYARGLRKAQEGGAKWWLEYRIDADSRRVKDELIFATTLTELVMLAAAWFIEHPNSQMWLCSREVELPAGSPQIAIIVERETRASGN